MDHLTIDSKESGVSRLVPYGSQVRFLEEICEGLDRGVRHFVCLKARQLGISTISLALDLFWVSLHPGLQGALICDTEANRDKFRVLLERYILSLPAGLRVGIKKHNRNNLVLNNGSVFDYVVAGTRRLGGGSMARSRAWNFVHATECSSWGSEEGIASMMASLAQKHPDRLYIFESTARGYNLFWDMWQDAKEDEISQKAFFIGWWAKEEYAFAKGSKEYQHYWTGKYDDGERLLIDEVKQRYGHKITSEQIVWHRFMRTNKISNDDLMNQEYPWCVSGDTRVGTQKGIVKIVDVCVEDLTVNGKVIACGDTGEADIYKVTTSLGYELRGTHHHPLMTIHGQVNLSESLGAKVRLCGPMLREGDFKVVIWNEGVVNCAVIITQEFARLVGIYMGDGSIHGDVFSIACYAKDQDIISHVVELIRSLFGIIPQTRMVSDNGAEVRVASKLICDTFRKLGLTRNDIGKTMRKVHVPEFIWRSPRSVISEFLRGLFEADGFNDYQHCRVVLFSKYQDFMKDVQLLLLAFGITCRRIAIEKISGDHIYTGNELQLRHNEAIKFNENIGFISERKRKRYHALMAKPRRNSGGVQPLCIKFEDAVTSVSMDGYEKVYNLTVEGDHLFDANGILTHNTEEQSFIMTGKSFFPLKRVNEDLQFIRDEDIQFKGFRYHMGENFLATQVEQVSRAHEAELRIWEDPVPTGIYVIGADPAFGRSDTNDNHAIQVLRCYADKIIQVAEYATPQPETAQYAWVLAHLAGSYKNCWINLEINGPGPVVMQELKHLKQLMDGGYLSKDAASRDLSDIFNAVRWYLYHRPDSMGAGYMYGWKTNQENKLAILNQFRDNYSLRALRVRSVPLLEEMLRIVQDGGEICAEGRAKDDRVFAMALAIKAWIEWVRPGQIANSRTYEAITSEERAALDNPQTTMVNSIIRDFFLQKEDARDRRDWVNQWGSAGPPT